MKANLDARYDLYINGQWVPASDGKVFTAYNPATGEKLAECAEATKEDVDAAVKAAWAAFPAWRDMGIAERAGILEKIADIIDENAELLATIESMDNGKPIRETMAIDVPYSSDHFRYFAGAIRVEEGKASVLDGNMMSLILREPIGVVGQIVPWNFPFLMAAWKLAPALAAGNFDLYYGEVRLPANWDLSALVGTGGSLNYGGWADPQTEQLLAACAAAEDRAAALSDLCAYLQQQAPILPLCFKSSSVLYQTGAVSGLTPTAAEPFYDLPSCQIHLRQP